MTNHIIKDIINDMVKDKIKILEFIKKNKVVTSAEISSLLKISWNTADSWLKDLALENKIIRIKKAGGLNLWMIK